jgi:hypothetical protein
VAPDLPGTTYRRKGRRIERPVLETGIESRQEGWDIQGEYAKNDDMHMENYRLVKVSRVSDLSYPVDWGDHEKPDAVGDQPEEGAA